MKRIFRRSLYVLVPAALLLGLGSAFARGVGRRDPERVKKFIEFRVNETLDELDATEAQRTQILSIVDGMVSKVQAEHQSGERRRLAEAIAAAVESDKPDTSGIDQLIDERAKRMTALAHEAVAAGRSVHAQLTPDQRKELAARIREHHGRGNPF
jgi:Spy/CpxP family protein refolding chaperone